MTPGSSRVAGTVAVVVPHPQIRPLLLCAAVVVLAGCGAGGETTTTQPDPQLERADTEVGTAVEQLLDAEGLVGTVRSLDEEGTLQRTDWVDYRAGGDHLLVVATSPPGASQLALSAFLRVGERLFVATDQPGDTQPWTETDETPEGDRIPISLDLADLTEAPVSRISPSGGGAVEVTRTEEDDGSVRWAVVDDQADVEVRVDWLVGADGSLRSLTFDADQGLFSGFARREYDFRPLADPDPISPPPVGEPLDLSALVPEDLSLPEAGS